MFKEEDYGDLRVKKNLQDWTDDEINEFNRLRAALATTLTVLGMLAVVLVFVV